MYRYLQKGNNRSNLPHPYKIYDSYSVRAFSIENSLLDKQNRNWLILDPTKVVLWRSLENIRIQSFNILADSYLFPQAFDVCNPEQLKWSFRKKLIKEEILAVNADILCLQELEEDRIDDFNFLNEMGFGMQFAKKTHPQRKDGCAIFYNNKKFTLFKQFFIDQHLVPYAKLPRVEQPIFMKTKHPVDPQLETMAKHDKDKLEFIEGSELNRLEFRAVGLFCILDLKPNHKSYLEKSSLSSRDEIEVHVDHNDKENDCKSERILIVNTHLTFNVIRSEIKFAQLIILLRAISYYKEKYNIDDVFFCGDFNFIPNSSLYQMMKTYEPILDVPLSMLSGQSLMKNSEVIKFPLLEQIKLGDSKYTCPMKVIEQKPYPYEESNENGKVLLGLLKEIINLQFYEDGINNKLVFKRKNNKFNGYHEDSELAIYWLEDLLKQQGLRSSYSSLVNALKNSNRDQIIKESVYSKLDEENNNYENTITHFTKELKSTVDYIWYNQNGNYEVNSILQMPHHQFLKRIRANPSGVFGSDHFSIAVDFFKKNKKN